MSNKTYDLLAYFGRIVLPALATLWLTLAKIWSLPYGAEIGATISAIALFLNAVLKISSNSYSEIGFTAATLDEFTDSKGEEEDE